MLPPVNDTNGPIRFNLIFHLAVCIWYIDVTCWLFASYVEVVVYVANIGDQPPELTELLSPENLTAYSKEVSWYIAAHFSYSDYKSELFTLGNNSKTTDVNRNRDYRNVALQPGSKYFIYVLVVGYNDENVRSQCGRLMCFVHRLILVFVAAFLCRK